MCKREASCIHIACRLSCENSFGFFIHRDIVMHCHCDPQSLNQSKKTKTQTNRRRQCGTFCKTLKRHIQLNQPNIRVSIKRYLVALKSIVRKSRRFSITVAPGAGRNFARLVTSVGLYVLNVFFGGECSMSATRLF